MRTPSCLDRTGRRAFRALVVLAALAALPAVFVGGGAAQPAGGVTAVSSASGTALAANDTTTVAETYDVDNVGASYYTVDGDAQPRLTLERGRTYEFQVDAAGHPFHVTTSAEGGSFEGIYTDGVEVTGAERDRAAVETGTLRFTVPEDAPDTLYYQCGVHGGMGAVLNITDGSSAGGGAGTPNYENPNGSVSIASPENGSTVTSPVEFRLTADGFVVEPASAGVEPGHGHLHLIVDRPAVQPGETIPAGDGYYHLGDGSTATELDLAPGEHTVRLQAGDANHTAYNLTDAVTITVRDRPSLDVTGDGTPAADPDGDGVHEDLNGDGSVTPGDATVLFEEAFGTDDGSDGDGDGGGY